MKTGQIFDIQRFSLGNGPGIRTTVFFKGCPLRCQWCHNPESFFAESQISLNRKLCRQCRRCAEECTNNAHIFNERGHYIQSEKCDKCLKCVDACCYGCLTEMGKKYSVHQLTEILLADKEYYEKSGGGVTFSGGEPMLQFEFIETVINDIDGIHVALDTSGYCASSTFIDILKKIDLLLFDIKHMDSKQHKQLTGVGNKLILENFEIAIKSGVSLKVRYPMVAGVNDGDENILSMSKLLKKFKIDSLDVCVYHNYGISKYYDLGLEPMMFKDYTETQKKERIEFIRKCGINPVIV